jgi:hypothetical protein
MNTSDNPRLFVIVFVVLCALQTASRPMPRLPTENRFINWDNIKEALEAYESCPCEENAKLLLATVPELPGADQIGNRKSAVLALLESVLFTDKIVAGDESLAETAFRLLGYLRGGAIDEEIRISLSRFLIKKPEAFLRLLKKYEYLFSSEEEYPITMTEILDIVPDVDSEADRLRMNAARKRLYTERLEALKKVDDPELKKLRDTCILVIEAIIKKFGGQIRALTYGMSESGVCAR